MHKSRFAAPPEPSAEDAVKLAMLADLGVSRRDSMFEADSYNFTDREKRAAKLRARGEADDRRAACERGVAAGDDMAVALKAWNTASNFEADPSALHSEDIAGGQSHREKLRADRESGKLRDFDESRRGRHYGEERAAYVQSRNASGAYVAVGGATTGPKGTNRDIAATPRSGPGLQSAPIPTNSSGGRNAAPRPVGHAQGPSPHAAGTVRFGASGRRVEVPASRAQGNGPAPDTTRPAAPSPVVFSSKMPPRPTAATSAANVRSSAPISKSESQFTNTDYTPEDYILRKSLQMKSYWCAAVPEAREKFVMSHREAARYLSEGRRRLVNEITAVVKRGSEKEMGDYIRGHPERRWMVEAAVEAKQMVLETPNADAVAHYATNTEREDFWQLAKVVYASERPGSVSTSAVSTTQPPGNGLPPASSAAAKATQNAAPPSTIAAASTPVQTTTNQHTDPATKVAVPIPAQAAQSSSQAHHAVNGMCSAPEPQMTAQVCFVASGRDAQANGSASSSSRNSMRSNETNVTVPPPKLGMLNVTLIDMNGNFYNEQVKVEAGVNVSFTLNSTVPGFNMSGLLESLKAWAEATLVDGQSGQVGAMDRSRGLQGVVQRADGIWEEDEEL